jgi:hypothetical protein
MVRVNVNLAMFITTIKALSIVVWDSGSSDGQNLLFSIAIKTCISSPQAHLNCQAAFIHDSHISAVFYSAALLNVDLSNWTDRVDNANCINGAHLLKLVDLINSRETEP